MFIKSFRATSKIFFSGLCIAVVIFFTYLVYDFKSQSIVNVMNIIAVPDFKSDTKVGTEVDHQSNVIGRNNKSITKLEPNKPYLILVYTSFFGDLPWSFVSNNYFEKCPCEKKCKLSYDKKMFDQSDVVIFHARDFPNMVEMKRLHSKRPKQQRWGWFILESPINSPDPEAYDDLIDFSISMSPMSNIQFRAYNKILIDNSTNFNRSANFAQGKTKHVAWLVSNCVQHRIDFAKRLEKHGISVFVGGGCSGRFKNRLPPCRKGNGYEYCKPILQDYKFYFSAENSFCPGYITEKYFIQGFLGNSIPIVLGGANYDDENNAIPGSYINPMNSKNFQSFVDYLKMLDRNDTAYNEYFQWKDKWTSGWNANVNIGCAQFICDVCKKLHEGTGLSDTKISEQISKKKCEAPTRKYFSWFNQN